MKKLSLLFAFFVLLTAFTCENEPLEQDLTNNENPNLSCEQASLDTANAALAFINGIDGNYAELCNAYKDAMEALIEACGDPDGSIQQSIDTLGDCIDPNDYTDCEAAESAVNLAQVNFQNATDETYGDLCFNYKSAIENQIIECGDDDGSLQMLIDELGNCNVSTTPTYEIGDIGPGGGYVFYVENNGLNGLEIAPASTQFQSQWGCPIDSVAGTLSDFGSGQANTELIIDFHININYYENPEQCTNVVLATGDVAAKNCADLVFNGFDDWYMPSFDELQLVYDNLHSQGMGDIDNSHWFSSSTQDPSNITKFRVLVFTDGSNFGLDKNDLTYHRAIREF